MLRLRTAAWAAALSWSIAGSGIGAVSPAAAQPYAGPFVPHRGMQITTTFHNDLGVRRRRLQQFCDSQAFHTFGNFFLFLLILKDRQR